MLVENQMIPVIINKKNIEWYFSKNYEVNLRDEIWVRAEDLIHGTHTPC